MLYSESNQPCTRQRKHRKKTLSPEILSFRMKPEKRIEIHPGDGMLEENGKIYDYQNAIGMVITCDSKKNDRCKMQMKNGWNQCLL